LRPPACLAVVPMPVKRKPLSTTARVKLFTAHGGKCCLCGGIIDGTKERWIAEHIRPLELLGEDGGDNLAPAHKRCADAKTNGPDGDLAKIAKAKRREAIHLGAKPRGRGFAPAERRGRASNMPDKWYGWKDKA
jgi:5-methylcytosine-specific restriction enzyme A